MSDDREIPPELDPAKPKRGRPPGSKTKVKEPEPLGAEAAAQAWVGLWSLFRLLTWALGRFFVREGEKVELAELTPEEAAADAASLAPVFNANPTLARIVTFIGAPIAIIQRFKEKLRVTGVPKEEKPPEKTGPRPSPPPEASKG